MTRRLRAAAAALLLLSAAPAVARAQAQPSPRPAARPEDVASVDAIVKALYEAISGKPGEARNWDRLRSLFHRDSRLAPMGRDPQGRWEPRPITIEEYLARAAPMLERDAFTEWEVARRTEDFGHIVHVWSTYEGRFQAPEPRPGPRGINSLQLIHDGTRWWIYHLLWEAESPGITVPAKYSAPGG